MGMAQFTGAVTRMRKTSYLFSGPMLEMLDSIDPAEKPAV